MNDDDLAASVAALAADLADAVEPADVQAVVFRIEAEMVDRGWGRQLRYVFFFFFMWGGVTVAGWADDAQFGNVPSMD